MKRLAGRPDNPRHLRSIVPYGNDEETPEYGFENP